MRISAHLGTEAVICIYEFNVAMAAAGAVSPKKGRKKNLFFFPLYFIVSLQLRHWEKLYVRPCCHGIHYRL